MPRHSKNNTALGFFTRAEKVQLGYGTQKTRFSRHSCRDFDACFLCLQYAREPLICRKGHLTCKECTLKSIVTQKQENEIKKIAYEKQKLEIQAEDAKEKKKEKEEDLKRFESQQVSLLPSSSSSRQNIRDDGKSVIQASKEQLYAAQKETSRGAVLIQDKLQGDKEREKQIENDPLKGIKSDSQAQTCFWIPSLTPSAAPTLLKEPTLDTQCFGGDPPHKIRLKQLISVKFQAVDPKADPIKMDKNNRWRCPGCVKSLSNNRKLFVLKRCGHVFCDKCVEVFIKKDCACTVCSKSCAVSELIEIKHGGTGYAGHGEAVEAQSYNFAFR